MKRKVYKSVAFLFATIFTVNSTLMGADMQAKVKKAKLATKNIKLEVGKQKKIKIKNANKKCKYLFVSTKKKVATVSSKGVVKAIKKGTAYIKVYEKKKKKKSLGKVKVSVMSNAANQVKNDSTQVPKATTTPDVAKPTAEPTQPVSTAVPTIAPLDENNMAVANYPGIASDIPDLDIIRVGQNYYMVSTTMNLVPGVPIMKSTDLVNWEIVNYACKRFPDKDLFNLSNGKQTYKNGSWAASLKYDEATKLYYVVYNVNSDGFYCYTTNDIENGEWKAYYINSSFHDPALFIENGEMFVIYSGNNIQKISLKEASSADGIGTVVKEGKSRALFDKTTGGFTKANNKEWTLWEGAHCYKVGDYYYLMLIGNYGGGWYRREVCYRSKKLYDSEPQDWEAQLVFEGSTYEYGTGIAQGGIVQTQYGDWYGFLFQDHDGLGRVPSFLAVNWDYTDSKGNNYKDWPMMGYTDSNNEFVNCLSTTSKVINPITIRLNKSEKTSSFVGDDDFTYPNYKAGDNLKTVWQWNHNPDDANWSVTERPGYYRIKNGIVANNIWFARNSLTQRTVGPQFASETCVLTNNMKPGDYAGLAAVSAHYGMVGVKCDENGNRYVFQGINSNTNSGAKAVSTDVIKENAVSETKIEGDAPVYLKIEYVFTTGSTRADRANFFYSLDGSNWTSIGKAFALGFSTETTFMGTRTWLVNYATKETGGFVDFDYYKQNVIAK